ncbi:major facilitator superfamily domain-containing protein [Hyaloraphidium curvatum]|nr:major facilitator superfamily domain-containing protein [Hyaloraphidium curvatum]
MASTTVKLGSFSSDVPLLESNGDAPPAGPASPGAEGTGSAGLETTVAPDAQTGLEPAVPDQNGLKKDIADEGNEDGSPDQLKFDGGWGWAVVTASFLCNLINIGIQQSYGIFLSYYATYTFPTASISLIALVSSLQTGVSFFCGPFVAANIGASFSPSIGAILATQGILFGLGSSFVVNAASSAPAMWFRKRLPMAFGIGLSGSGIGGLVMVYLTQATLDQLGSQWTLRIYAIMTAGLLIPSALTMVNRGPRDKTAPKQPIIAVSLFKNSQFLILFLGCLFCAFAFPTPFFLPSYAADKGLAPIQGSTFLALATGISAVGTILAGLAAPRFGTLNMLVLTQLMSSLSIFLFWIPAANPSGGANVGLLYVFVLVFGSGFGPFWTLSANSAALLFSHLAPFPVVVGSIYFSLSLPFFTNSPIFGAILDAGTTYPNGVRSANYLYAQIWVGGIYLLGTCCFAIVRFREAKWKLIAKVALRRACPPADAALPAAPGGHPLFRCEFAGGVPGIAGRRLYWMDCGCAVPLSFAGGDGYVRMRIQRGGVQLAGLAVY